LPYGTFRFNYTKQYLSRGTACAQAVSMMDGIVLADATRDALLVWIAATSWRRGNVRANLGDRCADGLNRR
jgi:hypothetical protein